MSDNYRMNEGRHAGYRFVYSRRDTGEVLLEGVVTGGSKSDCRGMAHTKALQAGIKPFLDDNIKLYMTPVDKSNRQYSQAQNKATQKYIKNNYDEIKIRVPKGKKEEYKTKADAEGKSLNQYIVDRIEGVK